MARGINKVILVGNLGNDPDVKYTQGGMAITRISLATTSVRKDKDGNQARSPVNTCARAARSTSKAACVTTSTPARTAWRSTPPTSSPMRCRCLAAVKAAVAVVAAANVRSASRPRVRSMAVVAAVVAVSAAVVVATASSVRSSRPRSSPLRRWTTSLMTTFRSNF
jgi:hypothetical protein